ETSCKRGRDKACLYQVLFDGQPAPSPSPQCLSSREHDRSSSRHAGLELLRVVIAMIAREPMTMNLKTRGKLTLADLMIIVAGVALGAAALRTTLRVLPFALFPIGRLIPFGYAERNLDFLAAHGVPLLVIASLVVVLLTLRRWARLPR